ncbi:hypothetical protein ABZX69_42555 [Streptomyces sp. NPDC004074]|uniref:hypothetical protein n=1 Tax=unclassified Streptomyces TaxID=2593676 RepID=UPI0033BC6040
MSGESSGSTPRCKNGPGIRRSSRWCPHFTGYQTHRSSGIDWPVEGVLLDGDGFWYEGWGERPADETAALDAARHHLAEVPVLVPVYAHRYLPAGREFVGHPVLSMWQTDIIYYLADYVHQEFDKARG